MADEETKVPRHEIGVEVRDSYVLGDELGSGTFSTVRKGTRKKEQDHWAVKIIKTKGLDEKGWAMIENEIHVLRRVHHPNIISCNEVFQSNNNIYLILELITGGELFDKIVELTCYSEKNASKCVRQMVEAIQHMHNLSIAHRDLKPENLLLGTAAADSDIKLADFGLAHLMDLDGPRITAAVGTPGYIAPEVLMTLEEDDAWYDHRCDIWGVGVITYILLCGFPPFYDEDDDKVFDKILDCDYSFPLKYWTNVSDEAKDLIKKIFVVNPDERITTEQILEHEWIKNPTRETAMESTQEEMKKWRARQRWKAGIGAVIAAKRFNFNKALTKRAESKKKERKEKKDKDKDKEKRKGDNKEKRHSSGGSKHGSKVKKEKETDRKEKQ